MRYPTWLLNHYNMGSSHTKVVKLIVRSVADLWEDRATQTHINDTYTHFSKSHLHSNLTHGSYDGAMGDFTTGYCVLVPCHLRFATFHRFPVVDFWVL